MKELLAVLVFFICFSLFAQIEKDHVEEYKQLIFNVQSDSGQAVGTAFIVGKNASHYFLVTAKHVLNGGHHAVLRSIDGTQYKATVAARHDVYDLALLQAPLLPIDTDRIPMVSDVEMNDEAVFVSAKDSGKIFPSKKAGIVRDVTEETISLVMNEVEPGHSGSPVFSMDGIVGMIIRKGRFVDCINITLAKEVIDDWNDGLFEDFFVELRTVQIDLAGGIPNNDKEMRDVAILKVESSTNTKNLGNLFDNSLETWWVHAVEPGGEIEISFSIGEVAAVESIKIHLADKSSNVFPTGQIRFIDSKRRRTVYTDYASIFKKKEKSGSGYWFVYNLPKPEAAVDILLQFKNHRAVTVHYYINEIQLKGAPL